MEYAILAAALIFIFLFTDVEDILFCAMDLVKFMMRIFGLHGNENYQSEAGHQLANSTAGTTNLDEQFVGSLAETSEQFKEVGTWFEGRVKLHGVSWKAVCRTAALPPGTIVTVKKLVNLSLEVEPQQPSVP
jgi:membrane protein implicated in regulation of membrane protease activity